MVARPIIGTGWAQYEESLRGIVAPEHLQYMRLAYYVGAGYALTQLDTLRKAPAHHFMDAMDDMANEYRAFNDVTHMMLAAMKAAPQATIDVDRYTLLLIQSSRSKRTSPYASAQESRTRGASSTR